MNWILAQCQVVGNANYSFEYEYAVAQKPNLIRTKFMGKRTQYFVIFSFNLNFAHLYRHSVLRRR